MNCSYHSVTLANNRCTVCARPLCPACDHRVKGETYCQDCIVTGIDGLRGGSVRAVSVKQKAPGIAALFGLIPGLGAVYNGTIIRALVHFAVTAGLWQLDDIFNSKWFWWSGVAFYAYTIFDAFKIAQRINLGDDLQLEETQLKYFLQAKTKIWGGVLISLGILTMLSKILPLAVMQGIWPVLFIGLGIYFAFIAKNRITTNITNPLTMEPQQELPPTVINFDPLPRDYSHAETRRFDVR